jgi:hypothetical protein
MARRTTVIPPGDDASVSIRDILTPHSPFLRAVPETYGSADLPGGCVEKLAMSANPQRGGSRRESNGAPSSAPRGVWFVVSILSLLLSASLGFALIVQGNRAKNALHERDESVANLRKAMADSAK